MWPSKWLRIENDSPELLTQCRGLRAEVWEYQVGHGQLLVRFFREGSLAGIYLYCKICHRVQFDSYWLSADVRIEISQGQHGPIYTIIDGDRLRIVCGAAFLAESPELIRIPRPNEAA